MDRTAILADTEETLRYRTLLYLHTLSVSGYDFYLPGESCLKSARHRNHRLVVFYIHYPRSILLKGYLIESGDWNCPFCTPCPFQPDRIVKACNGVAVFVHDDCVHHSNFRHGF